MDEVSRRCNKIIWCMGALKMIIRRFWKVLTCPWNLVLDVDSSAGHTGQELEWFMHILYSGWIGYWYDHCCSSRWVCRAFPVEPGLYYLWCMKSLNCYAYLLYACFSIIAIARRLFSQVRCPARNAVLTGYDIRLTNCCYYRFYAQTSERCHQRINWSISAYISIISRYVHESSHCCSV